MILYWSLLFIVTTVNDISNVTGDCYYQQINDNAVHYLSPAHIWPYSAKFLKESIFKNYKKFWKHKFESFTLSF